MIAGQDQHNLQKQSFQITTLRNDLQSMQRTIDRLRNDFEDTISEIPPQLTQKLLIIKQKQKSIASLVEKERFKVYQSRFINLDAKISELRKRVDNYVSTSQSRASDNRYQSSFERMKEEVNSESQKIRSDIQEKAMRMIDSYEKKFETTKGMKKLEFHTSLSLLPNDQRTRTTIYKDEIDNAPLISRLDKTQSRIDKLQSNFQVYQQRKQRSLKKKPENISDELSKQIEECHQNLLKNKTIYANIRTDQQSRGKTSVIDILMEKSMPDEAKFVKKEEFADWCSFINQKLSAAGSEVEEYIQKSDTCLNIAENRITGLREEIDNIFERVTDVDQTMNDYAEVLNSKIGTKIDALNNVTEVNISAVRDIFTEFRDTFMEAREKMMQEIEEARKKLNEAEDITYETF